jgi:hypothetical protein
MMGAIKFLRETAFYGQIYSNLDMAETITTSSEASIGDRLLAASYLTAEGPAQTVAIGGSTVACLAGGCQAIGGTVGGALSIEIPTYWGMDVCRARCCIHRYGSRRDRI